MPFITYIQNKTKSGHSSAITVADQMEFILSGGDVGVKPQHRYIPEFVTVHHTDMRAHKYQIPYALKFLGNNYSEQYQQFAPLVRTIVEFYKTYPNFTKEKEKFYKEGKIPKKRPSADGKVRFRTIHEPMPELKRLQRYIAEFMEMTLKIHPHNAAHAYRKNRDFYTNAEVHQKSNHVVNIDLKDFFPSITEELIITHLKDISIFSYFKYTGIVGDDIKRIIRDIADIATYKGCLPQGSPLSPYLTNILMTRLDYYIEHYLESDRKRESHLISTNKVMYTRYADDLTFSSIKPIKLDELLAMVNVALSDYQGLKINEEKTKYLKYTGKCYITGVKLNQDHNITIGHEKKKEFKKHLNNIMVRKINNDPELSMVEVAQVLGYFAFLKRVETGYANYIEQRYLKRFQSPARSLHQFFE